MEKVQAADYVGKLVRVMVEALVDSSGDVRVVDIFDGQLLQLQVSVASSDRGKVVGKGGKTARSIRILAGAAARKHQIMLDVNIVEEGNAE